MESSLQKRVALILGATGGIGGESAIALARHGWKIRALNRNPDKEAASLQPDWEWVKGDSMDKSSVVKAASGAAIVVHAVNPPGYRNWAKLVIPMLENTIEAARISGARILLPGTIYNYGPDAYPLLLENSPQHPILRKGKIRVELERTLQEAASHGIRTLILRLGDFFGPKPGNSWFSQAMVKPGRSIDSVTYPGKRGVGHNWAYLPDAGEAFALLANREAELETFARFHFSGHWDPDGTAMIAAIRRAAGKADLPVKQMPWGLMRLAAPFNQTVRELGEMQPLWESPIKLDNGKLLAFLGAEPHTPLDEAVSATLKGLRAIS